MGLPRLTLAQAGGGRPPARLVVCGPAGHDVIRQLSSRLQDECLEVIAVETLDALERTVCRQAPTSGGSLAGILFIASACESDLAERVRRVRRCLADVPVLVLVAGRRAADRLAGLDAGADDCLSLPICASEVLLRVRRLRREVLGLERPIELAGLQIDPQEREVRRGDIRLNLRPREWRLLLTLARYRGETVAPQLLLQAISGEGADIGSNVLEAAVSSLRRVIDEPGRPSLVVTVRGRGYRLRTSAEA